jgi:hypothetical protein
MYNRDGDYFLRLRTINKAPVTSAMADPPVAGSISGTAADATQQAPATNNNMPKTFCIFVKFPLRNKFDIRERTALAYQETLSGMLRF